MATKRKKAAAKAAQTRAPQPMPEPIYTCRKCGHNESVTQLRKVVVDVGWKLTQIHAIAPCIMCTKCGHSTVAVNATIGDLAGLVPEAAAAGPSMPTSVAQCDDRIAEFEKLKKVLANLEAKAAKGKRKRAKAR